MEKQFKIIAIGPLPNVKKKSFSGQAIMFSGMTEFLKDNNSHVDVIDISSSSESNSRYCRYIEYVNIFLQLLFNCVRRKYDLAYLTSSLGKLGIHRDIIFIFILRIFRVKIILHQFGADISGIGTLSKGYRKRFCRLMESVSAIIVEGNYIESLLAEVPEIKDKLHVIPNGLPYEGRRAQRPKYYDGGEPFVLFYLSNLIRSKGYFDVLKAMNILVNIKNLNVRCVFAGRFMPSADDEIKFDNSVNEFNKYIDEHGLKNKIEYFVGLYGNEKEDYFLSANVFTLPTYYINEGQPVSIIEAMSYGCVPLVTEYRHIPMMVNENNGCFVMPRDPEGIAAQIEYLITHPDIYEEKSKQCIVDYQNKYKFEVYAAKVWECMLTIIS